MIIFDHLNAQNFFRIGKKITWMLRDQGLVAITGINRDSHTANSNGAGKSTLFEALLWVIWGLTVRGYKGDQVVNRKTKKDCAVFLEFEVDGVFYQILRCRKHTRKKNGLELWSVGPNRKLNDMTGHTMAQTQDKINSLMGIDFDTFIRGPMMPQGTFKRFSEMTDAETKAILDQIVQTDIFAQARKVASNKLKEVEAKRMGASALLSVAGDAHRDRLAEIESLKEDARTFEKQKQKNVAACTLTIVNNLIEQDEAYEEIEAEGLLVDAIDEQFKFRNKARKLRDSMLNRHNLNLETETKNRNNLHGDWVAHKKLRETTVREVQALKKLGLDCPTCHQKITPSHIYDCQIPLTKKLSQLDNTINTRKRELHQSEKKRDEVIKEKKKDADNSEQVLDNIEEEINKIRAQSSQAKRADHRLSELQNVEKLTRKHLASMVAQPSSAGIQVAALREKLKEDRRQLINAQTRWATWQREANHLEFWVEGFGNRGVKSLVLESVTPYLNDRARYYSKLLTGGELVITFQTQEELKSGGVRDSFSVKVRNKNGAEEYIGNSGGEKSRADVIINLDFSDLVASRAQKSYPQRFFDEPFENLDERGVEAVVEMLAGMAKKAGSIFVVTHQDHLKSLFNQVLTVEKKHGISTIKEAI